ncbi:MAG TPA: GMC family oxidoreductase [Myxococcaceae bacterium]|nr:GMC family oxidoreductase [Myxococcaceae bacterium]
MAERGDGDYDALIVGSGASGGWMAKALTGHGLRVLLLEAGPLVRFQPEVRGDARWARRKPVQATCWACSEETERFFVDDGEEPYDLSARAPFLWIRGRQVGGRTLTWSRQCYRMSDWELRAASQDGHGEDWPLSHRELAPYYAEVERFIGVCGRRDGLEHVPDGAFRPPPRLGRAAAFVRDRLWARLPRRAAISSRLAAAARPSRVCPACGAAGDCDGFPYFTSPGSTLHAALRTGRLTVRAGSVVSHVEVERGGGLARGCAYVDRESGKRSEVRARVVVLCASTVESARLLLNSEGVEDASGQLGRNLMDHTYGVKLLGTLPSRRGGGGRRQSLLYIPWPGSGAASPHGFLRGYGVQMSVYQPGPRDRGPILVNLQAFGEMLPRPENRVTLSRRRDAWGIRAPRIRCRWSENELAMAKHQGSALEEIAAMAGVKVLKVARALQAPGSAIHEVGTARMGSDRRRSVLDPWNRVWGMKNLYVVDGSCFPSIGFQNPTLTMMALAARAGDHIAARMRRREL